MKNFINKIILGTITLGLVLSTVFSPFFSPRALAETAYILSATSATENTINFQVTIQAEDQTDLQSINPLEIEYSVNQDYSSSLKTTVPDFDTVQLNQNKTVAIGGLTPETTYYARLLNSASVSLFEQTAMTSATGTTTQNPSQGGTGESSTLPICHNGGFSWNIIGCIAQAIYGLFFVPTSFLFSLSGQLMDFSMAYTLNSANYGKTTDGSSFVEKGWTITRDLSNLLFIVMLMYIAINIILGKGADKKLLGTIILVGLLINFSLFFARVIIDASNILGKIFYDNMGVETNADAYINNPWIGEGDKSISIAIVSNFNPQKLFSQAGTLKLNTKSGVVQEVAAPDAGPFIIITLIMSIINLFGMYIFFVVAFILIGRVIGLWLLMIFAPIAFISYIMPSSASGMLDKMHHSKWWPELLKQSFVVPIFLFLLYLILLFVNTGFLKGFKTFDNTTTGGILDVIVPLIIITFLLKQAKDIATSMSGDIGKAFASAGSAIGGLALGGVGGLYGKALGGGAGALGRATLGKAGTALSESRFMKNMENRGGLIGSAAARARDAGAVVGSASFDVRAIKAVQQASGNRLGQAQKGGFVASRAEQGKRQRERANDIATQAPSERVQTNIQTARRELVRRQEEHRPVLVAADTRVTDAQNAIAELRELGVANTDPRWTTAATELTAARADRRTVRATYLGTAEANLRTAEGASVDQRAQSLRQSARNIESNRVWRTIVSGGEYSQTQANTTADEIRRSIRQPST
ncbi:MAG TPA: hypothetical protein PK886_01870 [Candidatus Paceibacterota bacterium]|nr:hypothetical protein [Candidatus Paceibacterota bacterium]